MDPRSYGTAAGLRDADPFGGMEKEAFLNKLMPNFLKKPPLPGAAPTLNRQSPLWNRKGSRNVADRHTVSNVLGATAVGGAQTALEYSGMSPTFKANQESLDNAGWGEKGIAWLFNSLMARSAHRDAKRWAKGDIGYLRFAAPTLAGLTTTTGVHNAPKWTQAISTLSDVVQEGEEGLTAKVKEIKDMNNQFDNFWRGTVTDERVIDPVTGKPGQRKRLDDGFQKSMQESQRLVQEIMALIPKVSDVKDHFSWRNPAVGGAGGAALGALLANAMSKRPTVADDPEDAEEKDRALRLNRVLGGLMGGVAGAGLSSVVGKRAAWDTAKTYGLIGAGLGGIGGGLSGALFRDEDEDKDPMQDAIMGAIGGGLLGVGGGYLTDKGVLPSLPAPRPATTGGASAAAAEAPTPTAAPTPAPQPASRNPGGTGSNAARYASGLGGGVVFGRGAYMSGKAHLDRRKLIRQYGMQPTPNTVNPQLKSLRTKSRIGLLLQLLSGLGAGGVYLNRPVNE